MGLIVIHYLDVWGAHKHNNLGDDTLLGSNIPPYKGTFEVYFLFPEVGYGSVFSRETSSPSIQGFLSSKQQVTNVKSPKPISS